MQVLWKSKHGSCKKNSKSLYTFTGLIWGICDNINKGDPINFLKALKEVPQNPQRYQPILVVKRRYLYG